MLRRSAVAFFSLALLAIILLAGSGCQGLTAKQGRPDRGLVFRSPLSPLKRQVETVEDVRKILAERAQPVHGLKARLEIIVGAAGRRNPKQRFDAMAYVDPPNFLRIRANQNGAVVFDLLVDNDEATVVIVPERLAIRGSLRELNRAPRITGGIRPADLFDALNIESRLVELLRREEPQMASTRDTLQLWFAGADRRSATEIELRRSDLLTQRLTRWQGRRKMGEVRFWAYDHVDQRVLVPTTFALENADGGALLVNLSDVKLNEPRTPQLATIDIPEGFKIESLETFAR